MNPTLSSLSSKYDRTLMSDECLNQSFTEYKEIKSDELDNAVKDKCYYYKARETVYADPPYKNQAYALFSWLPSTGATPDKNGVYGMLKVRGTFDDESDMNKRAEFLISHCDSFHRIYHAKNGVPVPLTLKEEFSRDVKFVRQSATDDDIIHTSVKSDEQNSEEVQKELEGRIKKIRQEEKNGAPDLEPMEDYIQSKVKIAFNMNAIDSMKKQLEQSYKIIRTAHEHIKELENENPEFKDQFMERYNNARRTIGVTTDEDESNKQIEYMQYTDDDLIQYLQPSN